MAKLKLNVPDAIATGKMVSFIAPCNCDAITCLQINGADYAIVDASGQDVLPVGNVWESGALITVSLDAESNKAYIQNPNHFAKRSFMVTASIDPNAWNGSAVPFNQSISIPGVKANSVVEVSLPSTATADHVKAFQKLGLQDGGQTADSITLKAYGSKNTVAIPINVIVRGDL